ncbi:hypothetical protein [Marinoscillum pacificum]|uniref:hypothetical protein n=1 Tax=Marinoscillum pacificum TaxID=392723 RepID=UPI00215806A0|nr:hypothetical protein [Marinoscillum pacificum]
MIYLWHNSNIGMYEMGDFTEKTIKEASSEITVVYEFDHSEVKCAEKILKNLNRASTEISSKLAVA